MRGRMQSVSEGRGSLAVAEVWSRRKWLATGVFAVLAALYTSCVEALSRRTSPLVSAFR